MRKPARLGIILATALVSCAIPYQVLGAEQAGWSDSQRLSSGNTGDADIAVADATVHVVYGTSPVFYRRSIDNGDHFEAPRAIVPDGVLHETDAIEADGQNVFVLAMINRRTDHDWCCKRELGDLILTRSTDNGEHWASTTITSERGAFRHSLAVSGSSVHVVWSDFRSGHWEIYYRASHDNGQTWSRERRLVTNGLEETNRPQIAVDGDNVHVVWMDNRDGNGRCYSLPHCTETYYMRSVDGGESWGNAVRLTHNLSERPLLSGRADVAAFEGGAVVVSYDQDLVFGGSGVQMAVRSVDNGSTWGEPTRLALTPQEQTHSSADARGRVGAIAWFDRRFGENVEIYAAMTHDAGATWSEQRMSDFARESITPHVAVTEEFLHLVWLDNRSGHYELHYGRRAFLSHLSHPTS
jgi:hypothetical protein